MNEVACVPLVIQETNDDVLIQYHVSKYAWYRNCIVLAYIHANLIQ